MMTWDSRQKDYIFDHGGMIDKNGIAHFPKQITKTCKLEKSFRHPGSRMMVIPSDFGACLIFEHMHFKIDR